jgi:hypothetical protein
VITVADPYVTDLTVLEIRGANAKTAVLFDTDPVTVPGSASATELVFDKIGDTYFLSKVFLQGNQGGNQLPKSKIQQRLEENGSIAESHSIAASAAQTKLSKHAVRKTN